MSDARTSKEQVSDERLGKLIASMSKLLHKANGEIATCWEDEYALLLELRERRAAHEPATAPREASMDDAPSWLDNNEASAWANGYNAAIEALQPAPPPSSVLGHPALAVLFDSHSVWMAAGNVQSRDVVRVLDAIVTLIKAEEATPTKEVSR